MFFVVALLLVSQVEGKIKHVSYGMEEYHGESIESLQGYGIVRLEDSKVITSLEVDGQLKGERCEFGKVKVNGHAILDNCLVKKRILVQGMLEAVNSKFLDVVVVASEHTVFDGCNLVSIHVRESGKEEVVELRGGTKLTGTIKFDSGHGIVLKGPHTEFSGKVVGGVVK